MCSNILESLFFCPENKHVQTVRLWLISAGASVLQQLVEDAGLFERSEVWDVLCDNWDVFSLISLVAFIVVAVRQRAQEAVVLVRGEVISEERWRSEVHLNPPTALLHCVSLARHAMYYYVLGRLLFFSFMVVVFLVFACMPTSFNTQQISVYKFSICIIWQYNTNVNEWKYTVNLCGIISTLAFSPLFYLVFFKTMYYIHCES